MHWALFKVMKTQKLSWSSHSSCERKKKHPKQIIVISDGNKEFEENKSGEQDSA